MLYRSANSLYEVIAANKVATTVTGTSKTVRGLDGDAVLDSQQNFMAVFEMVATGGTSPTVDASVETSWDGTTWHTIASMTQLVGAGSKSQQKAITEGIGPYVRAKVVPGGTAAPDVYGTIRLVSNAPYQIS